MADYALEQSLRGTDGIRQVLLAYDIACQYCVNIEERFKTMFPSRDLSKLKPAIGKMHLNNHKDECVWRYGLNYLEGGTRLDGEELERFWSVMKFLAGSGKQMSPGSRLDLYDFHACFHNFEKIERLGG